MKLATFRIARRSLVACVAASAAPAIAQFPPLVTLGNPSSIERVRFDCPDSGEEFGYAIAGIGDINADGIDDFAIGAPYQSPPGMSYAGACFVYFGGAWTASTANFDVSALNGSNGFVVVGDEADDGIGFQVERAGDVNGDGIDDVLIRGPGINDAAGISNGTAMVLFGGPGVGASGTITASMLNGSNGFRVISPTVPPGMPTGDGQIGLVAAIGDVNHDGFADLAFSAAGWGMPASSIAMLPGLSRGITAADFDGDGDTDFVVSHETQHKYTLYRNQGGGVFSPLTFASQSLPRKVLAADVDHDGDIDLVFDTQQIAAPNQHRITVVKNIASGLFGAGVDYLVTGAANADFDLGDLNGDGFVDIVAVSYTYPTGLPRDLVTLINNQSGVFTVGQTLLPPNSPFHVRLGDLDGDGDLDAAVFQLDPKRLKFFSNDGTGTLAPVGIGPGTVLANPGFVGGFELGDLDGDGDLDVLGSSSVASVLLNNGGFVFTPGAQTYMSGVNNPTGPLLNDFDGDGDLDAWIGAANVDELRVFNVLPNLGNGTFESVRRGSAPLETITRGTLIDFDGDGLLDVACVGEVYGSPSTVALLHNNGDGTFDGAHRGRAWVVYGAASFAAPGDVLLDGLNGPNGFRMDGRASNEAFGGALGRAGDVDADGVDDFVVGASRAWMGGPQPGAAFVVRGAAGLGAGGVLDLHTASAANVFRIDNPSPNTNFPSICSTGDLDGDGIDDLALGAVDVGGGLGMGGIYVVFGAAGLGSAGPISLANPDGMSAIKLQELYAGLGLGESGAIVGDINADGYRDLIAGMIMWPYNGASIRHGQAHVLYGRPRPYPTAVVVAPTLDGTNGFTLEGDLQPYAYFGTSVASVGDVDSDGVDDILVGEPGWDAGGATYTSSGRAWLVLGGKYRAPQTYCTSKTTSVGCVPSIGWTGALPSVTDPDPFVITSTNTINQRFGLLFYSAAGRGSTPFLGGTLCVQTPLRRTPIASSGGNLAPDDCSGVFTFDWRAWMDSGSDPSLTAGTTVDAQFWSRDPPSTFAVNLSDALEFTIDP